jgi:hypothetical protein
MSACATTEELILLVDGELTENRATAVREHLATCPSCRREAEAVRAMLADVAQPIEPPPGAVERVLARLDETPAPVRRARWRAWITASLAAAALLAFAVVPKLASTRGASRGELVARGAPSGHSLARDVGVTVYRAAGTLDALAAGEEVREGTAYAVGYRNLGEARSAYLMVFAQDAANEVHWVAPAWLDPAHDPASEPLAHADIDALPSQAVVLEHPARGPMRVFTVVTAAALRVSQVERLAASGPLDASALRAAWPGAEVEQTVVLVGEDK